MTSAIAFDADVLIHTGTAAHPIGQRVRRLFDPPLAGERLGSVILLTEVAAKSLRADPQSAETHALLEILGRLDLRPLDIPTGHLALSLAVSYGLTAADAAHLATAVSAGAHQFLTNNRRDFPKSITEIEIIYPEDLPEPQMSPSSR